jgi:hypothetical protein
VICSECDANLGGGYVEGDVCSLCTEAATRSRRQRECTHGVTFDEAEAKGLSEIEVRARWPRRRFTEYDACGKCGYVGLSYASFAHYIAGGW